MNELKYWLLSVAAISFRNKVLIVGKNSSSKKKLFEFSEEGEPERDQNIPNFLAKGPSAVHRRKVYSLVFHNEKGVNKWRIVVFDGLKWTFL